MAFIPVSLMLVEILADREAAKRVAAKLGIDGWNFDHDSDNFRLFAGIAATGFGNLGAFWSHEELTLKVSPEFDDIGLALQADAWSGTFRSRLSALNESGAVTFASGLTFITQVEWRDSIALPMVRSGDEQALEETLAAVEQRYDARTSNFVAVQLEYRRSGAVITTSTANESS